MRTDDCSSRQLFEDKRSAIVHCCHQVNLSILNYADAILLITRLKVHSAWLQEILFHRQGKSINGVFRAILEVGDVAEHAIEEYFSVVIIQLNGVDQSTPEEWVL
jgi:hypothetical protein